MKKNIIIFVTILVAIIGLLLWGRAGNPSLNASATLTGVTQSNLTENVPGYNFGSVSILRGNVERAFALKNNTDTDIQITSAETSCMCTRAILQLPDGKEIGPFGMAGHGFSPSLDALVRPGEIITVRAIFDPAAHGPSGVGRIERAGNLMTNKGPVMMQFEATVTP